MFKKFMTQGHKASRGVFATKQITFDGLTFIDCVSATLTRRDAKIIGGFESSISATITLLHDDVDQPGDLVGKKLTLKHYGKLRVLGVSTSEGILVLDCIDPDFTG